MDIINSVLHNEKALPLVIFVVFAFVFSALMDFVIRSGYRKLFRHCKKRTVATINHETEIERHTGGIKDDFKGSRAAYIFRNAHYEFTVDGYKYTGVGEVYFLNSYKKVKIWYDPENPNHNCTAFEKNRAYGVHVLIGYAAVIAFFVIVFMILKHFA